MSTTLKGWSFLASLSKPLPRCITISVKKVFLISPETMWWRVGEEDHEAREYRVRPSKNDWFESSNLMTWCNPAVLLALCAGIS